MLVSGRRHGNELAVLATLVALSAHATEWSNTELQLQYGNLDIPTFAGGGDSYHLIYTLQHASGWKYGDNFFFVDVLDARDPGFQDFDLYSEWYSNFSLGKIREKEMGAGLVSDVGLLLGVNSADDANVRKYLPGLRLSLDLPETLTACRTWRVNGKIEECQVRPCTVRTFRLLTYSILNNVNTSKCRRMVQCVVPPQR